MKKIGKYTPKGYHFDDQYLRKVPRIAGGGLWRFWYPQPVSGDERLRSDHLGLYALQHWGQESAGMVLSDGHRMVAHKTWAGLQGVS